MIPKLAVLQAFHLHDHVMGEQQVGLMAVADKFQGGAHALGIGRPAVIVLL